MTKYLNPACALLARLRVASFFSVVRRMPFPGAVAALLGFMLASAALAADAPRKSFDLAPDVAERALKKFSLQSGREVLFATETAGGVRTNEVKGDYAPQEAADKLLAGTGLVAVPNIKTGAFTIGRAPDPNDQRAAQKTPGDRPTSQDRARPPKTPTNP